MKKEYVFNDFIWKDLYSYINGGKIAKFFDKPEIYHYPIQDILHHTVGLANFTIKNDNMIYLSIVDNASYLEIYCKWTATKVKGDFLNAAFDEIVNQNNFYDRFVNWRSAVFLNLLNITKKGDDIIFKIDEEKNVEISFKFYFNKSVKNHDFEILENAFVIELSTKSKSDIFKLGVSKLSEDLSECIGILKTIVAELPIAGYIIGLAYKGLHEHKL